MSVQANLTPTGLSVTNVSEQFTLTGSAFSYNHISTSLNNLLTTVQALVTVTTSINEEITRATSAEATRELIENKSLNVSTDATSDIKYPSVKAIKSYVDSGFANLSVSNVFTGVVNTFNGIVSDSLQSSTLIGTQNIMTTKTAGEINIGATGVINNLQGTTTANLSTGSSAVTQTAGTNNTTIATTQFVQGIKGTANTWTYRQTFNQPIAINFSTTALATATTCIGYSVSAPISGTITSTVGNKGTITGLTAGRWLIQFVCSYNPAGVVNGFSYALWNSTAQISQQFFHYIPGSVGNYESMIGYMIYDIASGISDVNFKVNSSRGTISIVNGEIIAIRIA